MFTWQSMIYIYQSFDPSQEEMFVIPTIDK